MSEQTPMDANDNLIKYPRTVHIESSRHGSGDDLDDVSFAALAAAIW